MVVVDGKSCVPNKESDFTVTMDGFGVYRPFPLHETGGGDGGPTCNKHRSNSKSSDINDIVVVVGGSEPEGVSTLRTFDIFPTQSAPAASAIHSPSQSPGEMAASLGFPFTDAQWKELERQAMIYKYMKASLPVPRHLLSPIPGNQPHIAAPLGSVLNLRFPKSGDLEPGRCRRTDGKKWRCSRDAAPDQKYCERHMHRGRPRSRKPVELHVDNSNNAKKTRLNNPATTPVTMAISKPKSNNLGSAPQFEKTIAPETYLLTPVFLDKSSDSAASLPSYNKLSLEWMMKGHDPVTLGRADRQWQHHLIETKAESTLLSSQHEEGPLNLSSYTNFSAVDGQGPERNDSPFLVNPCQEGLCLKHQQTERDFMEAWSNCNGVSGDSNRNGGQRSPVSLNGNLSLSSLTLSMGGNDCVDDGFGQIIPMGLGVTESESYGSPECGTESNLSTWRSAAAAAWAASTPGGPLAEVLQSSARTASDPSSSPVIGNGGDYGSPPPTAVSGIMHKTCGSLSDSSVSCPIPAPSSRAKSEPGFL